MHSFKHCTPDLYQIASSTCRRDAWGDDGYAHIEMLPDNTYGACQMYYVSTHRLCAAANVAGLLTCLEAG